MYTLWNQEANKTILEQTNCGWIEFMPQIFQAILVNFSFGNSTLCIHIKIIWNKL